MKRTKALSIGSLLFRASFALLLAFSLLAPMGSALAAQPQRPIEGDGAVINGAGLDAAPLLEENFDYGSATSALTTASGGLWATHDAAGVNPVQYTTSSLTMPSYASSGIGGSANIGSAGGEDVNRTFASQTGTVVYYAALVNLSSTAASTSGSYFMHLKNTTTGFAARVFARHSSAGLQFGIGTTSTAVWSTTNFALDTTYLVVAKHDQGTGASVLYVLDSCVSTEPTTPLASATGAALSPIVGIAIRQGSANTYPSIKIDGIRVATNWADAATCAAAPEPDLSMTKTVAPDTNVGYHTPVTYTVTLTNSGTADAANVVFTDTLPAEVDFTSWVNQPAGADATGDVITWSGPISASTAIPFVFVATHVGAYGDVVTNTAEYEYDAVIETAEAVFTVADAVSNVTFVYHDLEDVVQTGDTLNIAGDFNGWVTTATLMTSDAAGEVFTATFSTLTTGTTYGYKYVLNGSWANGGGEQVNTNDRSFTAAGDATQDDYRNVVIGWANLQSPPTLAVIANQATAAVTGQVYIQNVTDPAGEGRGIKAEVGYGNSAAPGDWTWFPMTFDSQTGNNDLFTGVMTPTTAGVYSYTTRYDGNWGLGNPNAAWTYTDLNGTPFEPDQTGVLDVAFYDIGVTKTGPAANVFAGDTFDYTIDVTNFGTTAALSVTITDTLPISVEYVIDDSGFTPTNTNGVLVWTIGDLAAGASLSFDLTVTLQPGAPSATRTNLVEVATTSTDLDPANDSDTWDVTNPQITSIHDVQYVTDPATSDASTLLNQVVWVEGIVTAEPGEIDGIRTMFIEDPAGGPWSGLHIFRTGGFGETIAEGDHVRVQGQVTEYSGQTELSLGNGGTPWSVDVLSHNNPLPGPELLDGAELDDVSKAVSEQWESVYVEFGPSVVTDISLGYGEWYFNDGTGDVRVDDYGKPDGDLTYIIPVTQLGDEFIFVRGIPMHSFGNYKLEPRYDADIGLVIDTPGIVKTGPQNVDPGAELTYTLTVENMLGYELTNLVITDVVPTENAAFARVLDGGTESGGIVTWVIASLPYQASVDVQFVVTVTDTMGSVITNDTYAVTAAEYPTPTLGTIPVITVVGDYLPVYVIQGDDFRSDFKDLSVKTVGVVTGFLKGNYSAGGTFNAFFIQDATGDGNLATSDGIMVISNVSVAVGNVVTVTGVVEEHEEYDDKYNCADNECMTVIDDTSVTIQPGSGSIAAIEIASPGGADASRAYYESIEGMLVTLPITANVVGPTSYGTIQVVRGDAGVDRVMRASPQDGMNFGVRPDELYGAGAPDLIVGSVVSGVNGPMAFTYGTYAVVDQDGYTVVTDAPLPAVVPSWPAVGDNEFSVAAFNTLNFDTSSGAKFDKVVATILQLNGPAFLSLEEIDALTSMPNLIAALNVAGYNYDYAYSHADTGGHGVAMLWNTDKVTDVTWSTGYQSCSPDGSSSSDYDLLWGYCRGLDQYPLFSRRPVVVTGTVEMASGDVQIVAIANHFKAKDGSTSADNRRLGQGEYLNSVVEGIIANGSPYVIVMGDLNDFEDSAPLNALTGPDGALVNAWFSYDQDRYSYIYNGVSQILDHILVSPALMNAFVDMGPLHLNADYPYSYSTDGAVPWRTSDHEPVAATFVRPVNNAPVAEDLDTSTDEDVAVDFTLVASDLELDPLTYTLGTPANGALSGTAPALTYTPDADWNGTDTFTFTVNDGALDSNTATVTITVAPVNDAPVAQDLEVSTDEDTDVPVTLVASDVDGDDLTYTHGTPANGTLSGTAPALTYTPEVDWSGIVTFTFAAYDGALGSNTATVTITVNAVNDAPVAQNLGTSTDEDTAVSFALVASDVDSTVLTYTLGTPANGTLSGIAPDLTYTPDANWSGTDTFTFTVSDGALDSNTATVTIVVAPVNDAPVAEDLDTSTDEDVAVDFTLVASDVEDDELTYTLGTPANGTLSGIAPDLTYTPDADWFGTDTFTFTVNDGELDSSVATVTIIVADVVDDPVLSITKDVDTGSGPVNIGDVVTYTISVANTSLVEAQDVHIVDTLPASLIGEDVDITVTVATEDVYTIVFTATVGRSAQSGATITNTATFEHSSGSGTDDASFQMAVWRTIFLPITFKNAGE